MIVLDLSQEQLSKNSVLAEILQASGILSDSGSSSSESAVTTSEAPAKGTSVVVLYTEVMLHEVENCTTPACDTSFANLVSLVLFCFMLSFTVI